MTNKVTGRGRPQLHLLNGTQLNSIRLRLGRGESVRSIADYLGVHPYAVLRVKRNG